MAQQTIGAGRLAQRTAGSKINANFTELYGRSQQLTATAAAAGSFVVPAGYAIDGIYLKGNNANAVTGGIKIGTAAGGTQVVAAQALAGNSVAVVPEASILIRAWVAQQTIYYDAVTGWNGANVTLTVALRKVF